MRSRPTVLVVDDDPAVVSWLVDALTEEGFAATGETSPERAIAALAARPFDLVVSDVEMPELRGTELLRAILRIRSQQPVVLITAFGSIDLAVECVRSGAADFIAKPFRIEVLVLALRRALRERDMRREIVRLREVASRDASSAVVAESSAMKTVVEITRRVARTYLPVLITGESGVGKGVLARLLHDESDRASRRFVQLNCAALPVGVVESELFGARRGAFTDAKEDRIGVFTRAHGGTLFLDEVGELPLEIQPKLLHALESGRIRPVGSAEEVPVDVRVVAATNVPLEEALAAGRFRQDLYHRLNVIRIEVPPLRERTADIEIIVDRTLDLIARRTGIEPIGVSPEAMEALARHAWPGNVRELINAVERAVALSDREVLGPEDFFPQRGASTSTMLKLAVSQDWSLAELERAYIRAVLRKTGGHKGRAAQLLGVDRRTLYRKAAELQGELERDDDEP